jgi:hypothetical protein
VTDQAPTYPTVLEESLPAARHHTGQYANNRIEADHGRLKARLRPLRGLKQDRSARIVIAGHALVQNVRRGHYELAVEEPVNRRVAVAFDELALVNRRQPAVAGSACRGLSRRNSALKVICHRWAAKLPPGARGRLRCAASRKAHHGRDRRMWPTSSVPLLMRRVSLRVVLDLGTLRAWRIWPAARVRE